MGCDVDDNPVGEEGGKAFGDALVHNRTLNTLELNNAGLGDEAAKAFGTALKQNSVVVWLSLSIHDMGNEKMIENNNIGDAGGIAIGEAVVDSPTMLMIDLDGNHISREYQL